MGKNFFDEISTFQKRPLKYIYGLKTCFFALFGNFRTLFIPLSSFYDHYLSLYITTKIDHFCDFHENREKCHFGAQNKQKRGFGGFSSEF